MCSLIREKCPLKPDNKKLFCELGVKCRGVSGTAGVLWLGQAGVLPDEGLKPCLLHWQVDSSPLSHQGSPEHSLCHLCLLPLGRIDTGKSSLVRSPLKDVFFFKIAGHEI